MTWLNLNIIQSPRPVKEPLVYTFGLQATPIRPLAPDYREARDKFWFGQVSGFNGTYLQGKYENHLAFRLAPKNLDWSYPESVAKRYRGGVERNPKRPLLLYLDRTWQQAPEDAQEYNYDWRGWGNGTRYTKVVRDGYAWYVNEWLRRGLVDGLYIDDACIDPTFALNWHSEPGDHLAYKKEAGGVERGFEFFDYRDLLKRIRWLFLDNQIRPNIVMHTTQTPYYPIYGFADLLVEGEDRYLSAEGEARDFITSWGLPRIRYANAAKWGVPVYWLSILSPSVPLKPAGLPVFHWYYQQNRAHVASLLLHDVGGDFGVYRRDVASVGCVTGAVRFIGYWDPANPVVPQTSNTYVSVYVGTTNLALVLVNTTTNAANLSFTVDPGKVKALLGSDEFSIRDVDRATIPPPDPTAKGLKLEAQKSLEEFGLEEDSDESKYVMRCIEETDRERDEAYEKAVNPEAFFESHNFRYTNQVLRLLIQKNDYRLLEVSVRENGSGISGGR